MAQDKLTFTRAEIAWIAYVIVHFCASIIGIIAIEVSEGAGIEEGLARQALSAFVRYTIPFIPIALCISVIVPLCSRSLRRRLGVLLIVDCGLSLLHFIVAIRTVV